MGNTLAGYGVNGADLVGCVMSLDTVVSQGCLACVWSGWGASIHVTRPRLTDSSSLRGPSLRVLILRGEGKVYRLAPEVPLFRGILMGSEAFLRSPSVTGSQTYGWTHQNLGLVPYSLVW